MPTHKIHLAVAAKVNLKLKMDLDSLMLGSVLPDLSDNDHGISHYQVRGTYEGQLANPDKFVKLYKNELDKPIMMGYLIHLLTDRFYNDYYFQHHCIFDKNGIPILAKKKIWKKSVIRNTKQSDFFKYDKWLLKNNCIKKFKNDDCVDEIPEIKDVQFNKDKLRKYIKSANNDKTRNLKPAIFYKSMSKRELDNVLDNCIKYIENYINNL